MQYDGNTMKRTTRKRAQQKRARAACLSIYLDPVNEERFEKLVEANPSQDKNKLANMCILKGLPDVERIMGELYGLPVKAA